MTKINPQQKRLQRKKRNEQTDKNVNGSSCKLGVVGVDATPLIS